jgi:hypothetical protein
MYPGYRKTFESTKFGMEQKANYMCLVLAAALAHLIHDE